MSSRRQPVNKPALRARVRQTFREQQAHDRKVVRAIGRNNAALAQKLEARRPEARLDHLVRERYPSFVDALRDLDDPLTLLHLFAALPADRRHEIAARRCNNARRLCLEWSAYVVRFSPRVDADWTVPTRHASPA